MARGGCGLVGDRLWLANTQHSNHAEPPPDTPRGDQPSAGEHPAKRRDGYSFASGLVTPRAGSIAILLPDNIDGRSGALTVVVSGILNDIARARGTAARGRATLP